MAVQRTRSNARLFGDVIEACLRTKLGERLFGNLQNTVAVPFRIGAGFSLRSWGTFRSHQINLQPETVSANLGKRRLSPFYQIARAWSIHAKLTSAERTRT